MKFNIELPFFPGFYESDLENSDTSYWAIKEELQYYQEECDTPCKTLTEDDLDFNYSDYEKDVRDQWVEAFRERKPEFVLSVEDVNMWSPRYYNFDHDRLYADVELADDWMDTVHEFMVENADWLRERIKDDWTSYDGFMSFMSNNFDDLSHDEDEDYWGDKSWYWHLFSGQSDRWECYISSIIAYMMYRENKEIRNDLVMYALDDVYAGSYVFLTEEGKAKVDAGIEDGSVKAFDPDQLTIPFED
jgi:hypothetical protein